jgi:dienelactone hydrolase
MTISNVLFELLCIFVLGMSMSGRSAMAGGEPVGSVKFAAPKDLKEWKKERATVRRTLWRLLGDLPERPANLNVRTLWKKQREGFALEKFEFDNGAGATVPGYLCIPDEVKSPAPAILYCHYHGGEYENGKEEIFKTWPAGTPPAVELTRRGYVVLAIDAYCFGERRGKGPAGEKETGGVEELTMSKLNLWYGRTLWGMMVRDDLLALDYLCSRPEVDKERIAVTGMSMGSTRSWWLAALDERITVAVCVACLTRYQDLIAAGGLRCHGIYYFVPGVLKHFDTEAVVSLIAPRPLLTLTGDKDDGSPASGVRTINSFVAEVYRLYGKEERFRGTVYPGIGHDYTAEMWQETLSWLDRWLKK